MGILENNKNPLLAAVEAGDIASKSALLLALREIVPSDSAHEEISRVAEFTQKLDARVNWSALMHMSDLPVALLICVDGGAFFKAENMINWDHADGIYGWSALEPNTPNEHPVMLEGDHFQAYSTQANISAISRSIAAGIERAESGSGKSKKLSECTSDGEKEGQGESEG